MIFRFWHDLRYRLVYTSKISPFMLKPFLWMLPVLLMGSFGLHAQSVKTEVREVQVFQGEAEVTRTGTTALGAGEKTVRLVDLPAELDDASVQLTFDPAVKVLDFKVLRTTQEHDSLKQRAIALEKSYKLLVEEHKTKSEEIERWQIEEQFLMANQNFGGSSGLSSAQFQQNLDLVRSRLADLRSKIKAAELRKQALDIEANQTQARLNTVRGKRQKTVKVIEAVLDVKSAGTFQARLSYLCPGVDWRPFYEVRVTRLNQPLVLGIKALVQQQTGEDWEGVKMGLSNAEPSRGNELQPLNPFELQFGVPYRPQPQYGSTAYRGITGSVRGRVYDAQTRESVAFASIRFYNGNEIAGSAVSDADGSFEIRLKRAAMRFEVQSIGFQSQWIQLSGNQLFYEVPMQNGGNVLSEVAIASAPNSRGEADVYESAQYKTAQSRAGSSQDVLDSELSLIERAPTQLRYEVKRSQDLMSDGQEKAVPIREIEVPALYRYRAHPGIEEKVYLFASLVDWKGLELLDGEAGLYIGDRYLGRSSIDAKTVSDTLDIALGRDEAVQIKRESIANAVTKTQLGSKVKETRGYKIEIRNTRPDPIQITVVDRHPISHNAEIELKLMEAGGAEVNEAEGTLEWKIEIPGNSNRTLQFGYEVRYPKGRNINLPD